MKVAESAKDWVVVGAGPAGLTYLAKLLSLKVAPERILWVDPAFQGGAFSKYRDVPGNTKVKSFVAWALSNPVFEEMSKHSSNPLKEILTYSEDRSCPLAVIHRILHAYTDLLRKSSGISCVEGRVISISSADSSSASQLWRLNIVQSNGSQTTLIAKNVCIAVGGSPTASHNLQALHPGQTVLSLDEAFSLDKLRQKLAPGDTIGVIGGSHSAFLSMYLVDRLNIPNVSLVNFHRSPVRYAVEYPDWTLYDNSGLKGIVAEWTKETLEKQDPKKPKIHRINLDQEASVVAPWIARCTKLIYAIGFSTAKSMPKIFFDGRQDRFNDIKEKFQTSDFDVSRFVSYSNLNGVLRIPSATAEHQELRGLYGFGMAFPEHIITPVGEREVNVGLFDFAACAENWFKHTKL